MSRSVGSSSSASSTSSRNSRPTTDATVSTWLAVSSRCASRRAIISLTPSGTPTSKPARSISSTKNGLPSESAYRRRSCSSLTSWPSRARTSASVSAASSPLQRDALEGRLATQAGEQVGELITALLPRLAHRRHHQQLHRIGVSEHVREQQDGRRVRPLEVVEDQHHRVLAGDERQQPGDRGEQPVTLRFRLVGDRRGLRHQRPQRGDEAPELTDVLGELGREVQPLAVRDAVLDGGDERLVGDERLGVRAPEEHDGALAVRLPGQLAGQARLADPRLAGDDDALARALGRGGVAFAQARHRLEAADELAAADLAGQRGRERDRGQRRRRLARRDQRHLAGAAHRVAQRGGQLARVLEAVGGVLGHRPLDDDGQRLGDVLDEDRHGRRRGLDVRVHLRRVGLARVRDAPAERLIEHAAERVDVGAQIDRVAAELLRRGVVERPHEGPVAGQRAIADVLGEPEVRQQRRAVGVDEDVGGLDVAVHDPALVSGVEALGDLADQLRRVARAPGARAAAAGRGRSLRRSASSRTAGRPARRRGRSAPRAGAGSTPRSRIRAGSARGTRAARSTRRRSPSARPGA